MNITKDHLPLFGDIILAYDIGNDPFKRCYKQLSIQVDLRREWDWTNTSLPNPNRFAIIFKQPRDIGMTITKYSDIDSALVAYNEIKLEL